MIRRLCSSLIVAAFVSAVPVGFANPASAQPDIEAQPDTEAPPPPGVSFDWRQLGMNPQVVFNGHNGTQKVTIPVPQGLAPVTLSGVVESAVNIPAGFVEAQAADGRFLGSVPINNLAVGQAPAPFTIDIGSVPVTRNEAQISLLLRVADTDTVCAPPPILMLGNFSAAFAGGMQAPTTIEEFLPAIAPVVDLYVDPVPTDAEKATTLSLTAAITRYYQPAVVPIFVRPLPRALAEPPPDRDPAVRAILIREVDQPNPDVRLVTTAGAPFLVVAGRADMLERQAALFRDGVQRMAQTDTVSVESADPAQATPTGSATFADLRISGNTSVLGESYIYLDLAPALATAAKPGIVDVHLLANYTPVDEDEKATMVVATGDLVLTTVRLDASGRVDDRFSIPAAMAARDQDVTVTLRYEPGPGACSPLTLPMNFEIDPMSTTSVRPGGAVEMGGFAALPQGFIPQFQVAFDNSDPDELAHAATLVGLIQRLTSTPLNTEVVSLADAASSSTSALIVANAQAVEDSGLNPPINPAGTRAQIDLPASTVIDVSTGLAALQSFAQNGRTVVLLSSSGPWSLANPLFGYVAALGQGWRELTGDVLVVGQGGDPQNLTVRADGPTMSGPNRPESASAGADVEQDSAGRGWYEWTLLGAGVVVALAIVGGGIYLVSRKSRAAGRPG